MKFRISAFTALIIFSGTASANWFDSFNNKAASFANTFNSTASNTPATIQESGISNNNTQANLGFGISLGSEGNTTTKIVSNENTVTNISKELNQAKTDIFAPLDFNPSYTPSTPPAVKVQHNDITPAQDYIKLKAMWEAQRKQAEEMLKRIEEAQKSVASQP